MSKQSCKPSDEQLVLSARSGDTDSLAQLIVRFLPDIQAKAGCYNWQVWNRRTWYRKA